MKPILATIFAVFSFGLCACDYPKQRPSWSKTTVANPFLFVSLQRARDAIGNPPRIPNALLLQDSQRLTRVADSLLSMKVVSVMDKPAAAPGSTDKHDFYDMGPYMWPNPNTANGMPWVYRDGVINNAAQATLKDRTSLINMTNSAQLLSMAYYITRNAKYSAKASQLLRTWFLASETKMNPDLAYSSVRPGATPLWSGILTGAYFCAVIDSANLLAGSEDFTETDRESLRAWFRSYYAWMTEDPFFKGEGTALNNHGTWYDVQRTCIAIFLNKTEEAKQVVNDALEKRLGSQVLADGSQPKELARTKALHYSIYNLEALFRLALLGEQVGVDVWTAKAANGATLKGALDYILPYALKTAPAPLPTTDPNEDATGMMPFFLYLASLRYDTDGDTAYATALAPFNKANKWNSVTTRLQFNY